MAEYLVDGVPHEVSEEELAICMQEAANKFNLPGGLFKASTKAEDWGEAVRYLAWKRLVERIRDREYARTGRVVKVERVDG